MRVGRGRDGAGISPARDGREEDALAHAIPVGAGLGADEGDLDVVRAAGGNGDGDRSAIIPILIRDREGRLRQARKEVGGDEDLDAVFLWVFPVLRVGAGDEDAAVLEEDSLGVVEAGDDGVGHDGEARADRESGIIENGVEVGVGGEAEAGHALARAVEDEEGAVCEGGDAGQDALGGHALEGPCGVGVFGLGGDAVVEGDGGAGVGATADHEGQGGGVWCVLGQEYSGALEGIGTATLGVVDGARQERKRFRRRESLLVEDLCFVVVLDENTT